jgi:6-phosphogluconolactonase
LRDRIPWSALHFFFGDERALPPQDERSNYGLAQRELLAHVPARAEQVHRLRGEASDLDAEARRAAAELRATLGTPPRLDLVLLGLGPDGHIGSLFAGVPSSADRGDDELVRHVRPPEHLEPRVDRLTIMPFLVVTARNVALQVTGEQKAEVLERALKGKEDLVGCPAQWLRHAAGRVVIAADAAAAALLAPASPPPAR